MTRRFLIERIIRQIYGGFPNDDSSIGESLVNVWMNDAIAIAAKNNYKDSMNLEQVGFVNNSFYTTFKGLSVSVNERFLYQITLPQLPVGIGSTYGISTLQFKDSSGNLSMPCIPLTENQKAYSQQLRPIPNRVLFYPEGIFIYAISTLNLNAYTASVSMISGGDSTNLDSVLNVPDDYINVIIEYCKSQLMFERNVTVDGANDGTDLGSSKQM